MGTRLPRAVAIVGSVAFIAIGMWAMVDPPSSSRPRAVRAVHQPFLQDVGAFQIGLGVVLLLPAFPAAPMG